MHPATADTPHSGRNNSIKLSDNERQEYENRLVCAENVNAENYAGSVIWGDNLRAMQNIPDGFADLVILDPPYNISKKFGNKRFGAMNSENYSTYVESWLHEVCKKLKPNGSLYFCGDWKCTAEIHAALSKELTIQNRITWQREKGRATQHNWKNSMEDIWFAVKDAQNYTFNADNVVQKRRVRATYREDGMPKDWQQTESGNFRLTGASNFWDDITVPFWSMKENTEHPTQKPEKLLAKLILASSNKGDMVFDPFLGSGTTCVVAKKLGRQFCGIEAEREYCMLAMKRLDLAETNKDIQGYSDGVFWERNTYNEIKCRARNKNSM